jgi:hypothetical protein
MVFVSLPHHFKDADECFDSFLPDYVLAITQLFDELGDVTTQVLDHDCLPTINILDWVTEQLI